jgi:hypothetical protein
VYSGHDVCECCGVELDDGKSGAKVQGQFIEKVGLCAGMLVKNRTESGT